MFNRWLTFTALLAVNAQRAAICQDTVSIAPTCRVKGHPQEQLTLNCGDGKKTGVVQYWYTPFGELQSHSFQSKLDPVFMHRNGSLVIPNSSVLHSGLYYCLLQHTQETTLWPYELHIGQNHQKNQELDEYEQSSSCAKIRLSRDVGSEGEKQDGVSDEEFAAAVAASVLLTFVLGFSTGALTRTHVLRCLWAVTRKLRSPRQQTDTMNCDSDITMTTVPPISQAFEMVQGQDDDSVKCSSIDTATSSSASSPPAKPQRSFRHKREEQQETPAYLEGGDYKKEERKMEEEEEAGRSVEEKSKGEEDRGGRGSGSEADEETSSEDREEKDGGQSKEEKKEYGGEVEEEAEEDGEQDRGSEEAAGGCKEKRKGDEESEEEKGCRDEKGGDDDMTSREEGSSRGSQHSSTDTEDDEETQEDSTNGIMGGGEEAVTSPPCPARRSRVIRLYQYDEDGQRYCHLPDPTPDDPGPFPRPRPRSISLSRLNTIMAAAAGPLDQQETGREEKEGRTHFHMDI